jgi:hypothetical protein
MKTVVPDAGALIAIERGDAVAGMYLTSAGKIDQGSRTPRRTRRWMPLGARAMEVSWRS